MSQKKLSTAGLQGQGN